ncbi:putative serine/threonine-protein kinase, partial [Haematococcus lacustris]
MEYLHAKRIVHFDLKAANVLVGWREGAAMAKVADFGLSKQRQQTFVTGVNSLRGTLPWTAPEIIHSPKAVTEK